MPLQCDRTAWQWTLFTRLTIMNIARAWALRRSMREPFDRVHAAIIDSLIADRAST